MKIFWINSLNQVLLHKLSTFMKEKWRKAGKGRICGGTKQTHRQQSRSQTAHILWTRMRKVSINVFVLSASVYVVDCKKLPSIARLAVKVALTFSKVAVERLVTEHTCKACFMVSARTVLVSGHKYVKQMDSARWNVPNKINVRCLKILDVSRALPGLCKVNSFCTSSALIASSKAGRRRGCRPSLSL